MTIDPQLQDITATWVQAEENFRAGHRAESLVTQIRYALGYSTLLTQQQGQLDDDKWQQGMVMMKLIPVLASHYPAPTNPHPVILKFLDFLWKWDAVYDPTRRYKIQRLSFLLGIVPYVPDLDRDKIIDFALTEPDPHKHQTYLTLLRRLPTYLNQTHITRIFEEAINRKPGYEQSTWLAWLAPYLPATLLMEAWEATQKIPTYVGLPSAIGEIALHLPHEMWPEAFPILLKIPNERSRADAFTVVSNRLSVTELDAVIENALTMQDRNARYITLARLIPKLSEEKSVALYIRIGELKDSAFLISLLDTFARYLPVDYIPSVLAVVHTYEENLFLRRNILFTLAKRMEGEPQNSFHQEAMAFAIELANQEEDTHERAEAFTSLLKNAEGIQRKELLEMAMREIEKIEPEESADFWVELSWVLRDEEFSVILEAIPHLQSNNNQMAVISGVAYALPDSMLAQGMVWVREYKEHLWYGRDCEQLGITLSGWAERNPKMAYEAWKANLHTFAELPRTHFLTFLANMITFAMALADDEVLQTAAGIYQTIKEIDRN